MSRDADSEAHFGSVAAWTRGWLEPCEHRDPLPSERYAVDAELGRGGMGVVHAATDRWLGRQVALKRPNPDSAGAVMQRMMREASITARLTHPSIAPILDVGEDDHGPYYTMPILVGRAPAPTETLFRWVQVVRDAARAVAHAHAHGIVHRDLKPDNLLLGEQHQLWVLDWGIAYDPAEPDSAVVGTPGFAAPEQQDGRCCPASDVYALGRLLALHPELDTALGAVVDRATAADPDDRYPDGLQLVAELERWLAGGRVGAYRYSLREVAGVWLAQNRALAAVTGFGLVTVIGLVAGAFILQAQAQARTNRALAESLVQRAESLSLTGARAEAEVFAATALSLAELPAARGVLMRWAASPRPVQTRSGPAPCAGRWDYYGDRVCVEDTQVRLVSTDGVERATAPFGPRGTLFANGNDLAFYDEVVLSAAPAVQWVDGEPHLLGDLDGACQVGMGRVASYARGANVYTVDDQAHRGELYAADVCKRGIQELVWDRQPVVVLCREDKMVLIDGEQQDPVDVPGHPVLARWLGDTLAVGTFQGDLALWDGEAWHTQPTGAGPVSNAVVLNDRQLLVTTERRISRVYDLGSRSWVMDLPRGFDAAMPSREGVVGTDASRSVFYDWNADELGPGLQAEQLGGIAGMALSRDGSRLAVGHAEGVTHVWDLHTGVVETVVEQGDNVAKAMVWDGDDLYVNNGRDHWVRDGVDDPELTGRYIRDAMWIDGRMVLWASFSTFRWHDAQGVQTHVVTFPNAPADAATDGESLWTIDAQGRVKQVTLTGAEERFSVPGVGRALAARGDVLAIATEQTIERWSTDGALHWSVPVAHPITALAMDDRFVVVGMQTGRVEVLDAATGQRLARHKPHTRRVSRIILNGDTVFTGSWDGTVTRMGLGPLTADPHHLRATIEQEWGLVSDDLRE